jgi:hypothetical protein
MWKGAKDEVQRNKAKRQNYTDYSLISCTSNFEGVGVGKLDVEGSKG